MSQSDMVMWRVLGIAAAVFFLSAEGPPQARAAIRASTAVANITTDKPTVPVHDPLLAKVLLLEEGGNKVVIICMDILEATDSIVGKIRRGVERELGIVPSNILVSAAQNHRTAGQVNPDFTARVIAAVKEAYEKLVPARIGAGVGSEGRITMNRRVRTKDGKHWTIRRATPSPAEEDVVGLGPIDPQIGLLRVDTAEGKPLALVYNFAGHPLGGVPEGGVTADFPGFASRVIEEAWPGAVALFLQGFCGDIIPIHFKDFDAPQPTEELGTKLGLSALKAAQGISTSDSAVNNNKRIESYRRCVKNMDRLITIRTNVKLLKAHVDKVHDGPIPADIQALRIGDFVVVTFPGEPFTEVGLRIKWQSPFPKTFVAGNTNGELAGDYAPTSDAYDKQGYEDSCTQLAPAWQGVYERKVLEMIGRFR